MQVDGQLKTGRDVVIAALLGAEEFGFATAPLVVSGCVMMRVCHLDTCPVGVATQNPELRKRFTGKPEFVVTFFEYIAEEVRELLAELGFRTLDEAIGHVEVLDVAEAVDHWKASGLDLTPILHRPGAARRHRPATRSSARTTASTGRSTSRSSSSAAPALERGEPVRDRARRSRNVNRTVGTMLGSELTRRHGGDGLPDDTITISLTGLGRPELRRLPAPRHHLAPRGRRQRLRRQGPLRRPRSSLRPPTASTFVAEDNIIAGNVILYGATSGEVFIRGVVGERFCVRNSGAIAVVEGVGDHGCEYMTGGRVVVLGATGRNFGAGMSGGIAFVLDPDGWFLSRVNLEMVDLEQLDDDDADWLRDRIERHLAETDSAVARRLLDDWDECRGRFVQGHAPRLQAGARGASAGPRSTAPIRWRRSWKRREPM